MQEILPFKSNFVRVGSLDTGGDFSGGGIIRSRRELDGFVRGFEEKYAVGGALGDPSLRKAAAAYTESFFAEKTLLISLIEEPSGSYRHEVESVSRSGGSLKIVIRRIAGGIGTCDMAQWAIFTAVDAGCAEGISMPAEIID